MATSAFRSASSTDDPGYSNSSRSQRRTRSLSRFPQRFSELDSFDAAPYSRGRFVNKVRGSQFLDMSLDDLQIQLFSEEKDMSLSGITDLGRPNSVEDSQRRGRSVSRRGFNSSNGKSGVCTSSSGVKNCSDRRRRSMSAARPQILDNERGVDESRKTRNHRNGSSDTRNSNNKPSSEKSNAKVLQKCQSQRDISTLRKTYSNHSSAQTDDESCDRLENSGFVRTIRAVHSETKQHHPVGDEVMNNGLYEVMRKELRLAVADIRNEIKQRDRCKNDVPDGELLLDEHELQLCQITQELNPVPENTPIVVKPSLSMKRSDDRRGMSKMLMEGAERYIDEFISSMEETEISSVDGDRSDAGSALGPTGRPPLTSCPRLDGVTLPWLLWETCIDSPLSLHKTPPTNSIFLPPSQEECSIGDSCSPNVGPTSNRQNLTHIIAGCGSEESRCSRTVKKYTDDNDEDDDESFACFQKTETLIFEKLVQAQRVTSGGLLLCDHSPFF